MGKIQYWKNGILMHLVTPEEAEEIIKNAKAVGWKVYDNRSIGYFTVEEC